MNYDLNLKKNRILIGKIGLDGHDRGALIISEHLRNFGYEVIYSGLHKGANDLVAMAVQENVVAIGISILSGSHLLLLEQVVKELKKQDSPDIILFIGGVIPPKDFPALYELGIRNIFTSGTRLNEITTWLKEVL